MWFDKDERAEVLRRSTIPVPVSRDPGTGLAVADVAGEGVLVGEAAIESGIIEGVLDVLGGIFSAIDF